MLANPVLQQQGMAAATLIRGAQAALDYDIDEARECLRQLEGLLRPAQVEVHVPPAPPSAKPQTVRGGLAAWQIRLIAAHIERNLNSTIAIADLARIARISNGHFCRAFKVSMGETAHTYITRRRIAHAQMLMVTTTDTLSTISDACGLTDQAHLTRLFRRFVSETPLAWRRSWRQAA